MNEEEYELRDRIAMIAFQTLMSAALPIMEKAVKNINDPTRRMRASAYEVAKTCYSYADAMMAAREVERDFSEEEEEDLADRTAGG